ncbi:amidase [Natronomonas sp. EA1]|uniref:amidase n=1 Tax=Natronomonas sp. EA1 TaxID=3421655 RepID=UPI003EB97890
MSDSTSTPDLVDATVAELHAAMDAGHVTAESLVDRYLARIDAYDTALNAVLTLNDGARERARELDAAFEGDGFTGPLHGIPILLKDNQDTHDMPTTAGATALADSRPPRDAFVVQQLREAGAVVLGKTNLQELSFGVDSISSAGGEVHNPYDTDHRPSGSSGGTAAAIAANLATVGTGSDTCSSVRSPPAFNALVGVRPTRGLVSRTGIAPLSESQDTAGPIARTVEDAARLLDVMAGYDPADPVSAHGVGEVPEEGYAGDLDADALDGARIGIARQFFGPQSDAVEESETEPVTRVTDAAIAEMEAAGATVVDPVEVVDIPTLQSARVLGFEFERDFDRYLESLGDGAPVSSLRELYETGTMAPAVQERFEAARILEGDPDTLEENTAYLRRLRRRTELRTTVTACLVENDLDALLYPPSTVPPVKIPNHQPFEEMNCELAAHTGLPSIVVPAGYTDDGLPVGVELLGRQFAERRLFDIAYSYEQTAGHREPPEGFGPLDDA